MRFRKLRIAWSVACGIACVLLIALWVRSAGRWERVYFGFTKSIGVNLQSGNGQVKFVYTNWSDEPSVNLVKWAYYVESRSVCPTPENWRFHFYNSDKNQTHFGAPHWAAVLVSMIASAAAWLPRRFTLRTLLIATTLVAVTLGLIVYACNK